MSSAMHMPIEAPPSPVRATPRRRTALLVLVAVAGLALSACNSSGEGANLVDLNEVRASVGLGELVRASELDVKARQQAERMAAKGTIFHSSSLVSGVSEGWSAIGENVALAGSVDAAQRALEASPSHYENMANPAFNQVGIGVVSSNGVTYVVQIFVSR